MLFRRSFAFGGLLYGNFLLDIFSIFLFVVWFWLLITVARDLFRRGDVPGLAKAVWVILLLVFPYFGVLIYLISQGRGIAERQSQLAQRVRTNLRQMVGFSIADEIEKLDRLKNAGSISNEEFARLRARTVQSPAI